MFQNFGPIVSADTVDAEYHTVFSMIDHLLLFLHSFFQAEKKLSFIKSFWRQLCIRLENLWSRTLQWFSDKFFAKQILRDLSSLYALWCKYLDNIRQKWKDPFSIKKVFKSDNDCSHGLRTPNEGKNQRNLKIRADVADKICCRHT